MAHDFIQIPIDGFRGRFVSLDTGAFFITLARFDRPFVQHICVKFAGVYFIPVNIDRCLCLLSQLTDVLIVFILKALEAAQAVAFTLYPVRASLIHNILEQTWIFYLIELAVCLIKLV